MSMTTGREIAKQEILC